MLLHRCKWQLNETFKIICKHLKKVNTYVVFDGYKRNNIKLAERNRRALKSKCADIKFDEKMHLKIAQDK